VVWFPSMSIRSTKTRGPREITKVTSSVWARSFRVICGSIRMKSSPSSTVSASMRRIAVSMAAGE
jgi:hypothetical protein